MGQQEQPALVVPVVFFCPELENNPINPNRSLGFLGAVWQ